eukprot:4229504-Pyramimonas_sp.AAC.1
MELPMRPRDAVLGVADACGHPYWGSRWSSLWGHERLYWVWRTHLATPTGAAGGDPNGATKRCGPQVELPMGPRSAVRGTLPPGPYVELPVGPRNSVLSG